MIAKSCIVLLVLLLLAAGGLIAFSWKTPKSIGLVDGALASCSSKPNCVSSTCSADDKLHYVEPLVFAGSKEQAIDRLKKLVEEMPGLKLVQVDSVQGYVHCTSSTTLGFVDDVEFLVDASKAQIHVRSASRVGYSDFGANRKRVEDIRQRLAK